MAFLGPLRRILEGIPGPTNQAFLSGHFNRDRDAQPAKNQTSRVTSLPLPSIVQPGFQLTLCWLLRALFSFNQIQLLYEVSAWLPGTVFILDMYNVVVNSSYVLGSLYQVLARIPGTPYQPAYCQGLNILITTRLITGATDDNMPSRPLEKQDS
jgi:hypothetical protein